MTDTTKPNPFLEPLITLVVPALILMKLSAPERLRVLPALLLALAFPLAWGMRDLIRNSKLNLFAALGLVSVGLTGGIGLLQLDNQWLAVKEAAIPGMIGLVVFVSGHTRYSLIHALLLNPKLIDVARIRQQLSLRGTTRIFEKRLRTATWLLGGTFFFSAAMNYLLRHLDSHQPGRQPGLQRRTWADGVAKLPGDRRTFNVDDDGPALLPCPNYPFACRPQIHGDIRPARQTLRKLSG